MTTTRPIRLLLLLACLSAPGCAGVGAGRRPEPEQPPLTAEEAEHKVLERELSLYSD